MIWIAIVVLTVLLLLFVAFDIGVGVGRSLEYRDHKDRLKSRANHPSNHLRAVREE